MDILGVFPLAIAAAVITLIFCVFHAQDDKDPLSFRRRSDEGVRSTPRPYGLSCPECWSARTAAGDPTALRIGEAVTELGS